MRILLIPIFFMILLGCSQPNRGDSVDLVTQETTFKQKPFNKTRIRNHSSDKIYRLADSLSFEIRVWEADSSFGIAMKFKDRENFRRQIIKAKTLLKTISKEVDLSYVRRIDLSSLSNKELAADVAAVDEIQEYLRKKEKGERVSFRIVEENLHKSKLLNEFTRLFADYNVVPKDYYAEKCHHIVNKRDATKYSIYCPHLIIEMRRTDNENPR